jgi:DNA-directed RNA polymerase specialized sigma24 family protein
VHQRFCVDRGSGSVAPDFRVTTSALCIDPPSAKLIRGSWFAKVVVMPERSTEQIRELLDSLNRVDSGRILATLIRLLGDFDLAEETMHEAFAAALSLWPRSGVPDNPRPWLISTGRFKAIDTLRRRARFDASQDELVRYLEAQWSSAERSNEEDSVEDDRLRLIFTCCHPSLLSEAHFALTLRVRMNGRNRSLQCVGAEAVGLQGFLHQYHSLRDLLSVPERAILVFQQN